MPGWKARPRPHRSKAAQTAARPAPWPARSDRCRGRPGREPAAARARPPRRMLSGPTAPTAPTGQWVIDVTEATFQAEVLERSLAPPVVIDFWADWCGPCKQLSPVLERLAEAGRGTWILAKIDVDADPRIAQAFRVQAIPMVFAVVGGQPLNGSPGHPRAPGAADDRLHDRAVARAMTARGPSPRRRPRWARVRIRSRSRTIRGSYPAAEAMPGARRVRHRRGGLPADPRRGAG